MTIYYIGGEAGSVTPSDNTALEEGGADTAYQSAFSRTSLTAAQGASFWLTPSGQFSLTEGYIHICGSYEQASIFNGYLVTVRDSGGTDRLRLEYQTSAEISIQYNSGGGFSEIGTFTIQLGDAPTDLDIFIKCNTASGEVKVYSSGTLRADLTPDLSAFTSFDDLKFTHGYGAGHGIRVSQIVVADVPTIGYRVLTVPATGAGANNDWTGTFAAIDETARNDADFINSATANQVSTFVHSSTLSGYDIVAVAVGTRAKRGASGPTQLQNAIRSSGTDYFSSSHSLDVGYDSFLDVWETDPATASAWQNTAFSTLQYGVKSIA